jgi:hypothetical protein
MCCEVEFVYFKGLLLSFKGIIYDRSRSARTATPTVVAVLETKSFNQNFKAFRKRDSRKLSRVKSIANFDSCLIYGYQKDISIQRHVKKGG